MKPNNLANAIGTILILFLLLSACAARPADFGSDAPHTATEAAGATAAALPPADHSRYGQRAAELADEAISGAIALLEACPAAEISSGSPTSAPRREQLSESVRAIYDMLLDAVETVSAYAWDAAGYGETAFSDFMEADEALRADHPHVRAYYYPDVAGNVYRPIYFLPGDSYDSPTDDTAEITARMALFDAVCARIIDCMPDGLSDLGKYRYLAAVITGRCDYDRSLSSMGLPNPAYSALVNGSAVCSGYASALEHLCGRAGLFCQRVDGTRDGGDHAWNRICLAGRFYYCDLTAADAEVPGSEAWLQCTVITAERAKTEAYSPFRAGMTVDGIDEIRSADREQPSAADAAAKAGVQP